MNYILLGIIQGLTEFLPVSSSGHLVIFGKLFGLSSETLPLTVVLHLGTVFSLLVFFFKDIISALRDRGMILFILAVTAITGIIGLAGKKFFERFFSAPAWVGAMLIVTGIVLFLTKRSRGRREKPDLLDAAVLGAVQGAAIIPGISRSGITISTLLFKKFDPQASFRLSFLASIPAIMGAALLEYREIGLSLQGSFGSYAAGFLASFGAGLFALWALRIILRNAKLHFFGYYCIAAGIITLIFLR